MLRIEGHGVLSHQCGCEGATTGTIQEGFSNVDIIREQDGSTSRELNSAAPKVDKESNMLELGYVGKLLTHIDHILLIL